MLPGLAAVLAHRRGWSSLSRLPLRCRAAPSRPCGPAQGWQSLVTLGSFSSILPGSHLHIYSPSQVRTYSTDTQKEGLEMQNVQLPSTSVKHVSTPVETVPDTSLGLQTPLIKQEPLQVRVKAVLKKREYGPKYTKNNFITGVRAINEFCLKSSDLDQLRKIRQRSPHEDTESFTVYLRSDVEAKALEVWGSPEALARERKLRKEAEREYRERLFRNQKVLQEYKDFLGHTKPRPRIASVFLKGPGKVVMVAICINGLNFFFKLLAWIYTGSASMFSEAIHSLSDTCNQALLALGISQSIRTPNSTHPYGFLNMRYIFSLISGVGIFMMGAGLSWYHGVMGLLHPEPIESLLWAYCILAGSLVSEGATLLVAVNELRRSAQAKGMSFYKYVIESRDPSTNVVLLEDAAAVLGVALASACMGLTSLTGNPVYDSLGSLGVGTLLGAVSTFLIYTNSEALLGRSIQPEQVQRLTELLENDPSVRAIHDVKATDLGMGKIRFKAEVDFDGKVVTRSYLEKQDFDQLLQEIQEVKTPEELEIFMLKHGENIIDTLGAEVDRLERELKRLNPEIRHVDLEIL
ncbi:proton-coupled zinc antiporter SLC30A9, mitochondrial isoform X1 [Petaurus breviceps papuanus]|uniref:proton-coupled zinc antiporter SLC30A9, mitochondrial isoform X1 n=1 Tax=Petaurus breviceps papuanus TaxID=3040969 RepID=UPI0036DE33A5